MNSHAARVGTLVGLLDGLKRTGKGRIGTIERIYGHPGDEDLAMDVRFEDGNVALYWYDELAVVVRSYDGGAREHRRA